MSSLFETTQINKMSLKNRFVRSATWEGLATEEGACTPALVKLMTDLADGGVGMIIPGHAYVQPEGQASPWQTGIYHDDLIDGLTEMTDSVHARGGRMVLQLAHAGRFALTHITGKPALALAASKGKAKSPQKVMTPEDFQQVTEAFGQAARRAKAAGFDGVQIHAAHGYLLSQALSPQFNRRTDAYGGSLKNRARFLLEVLERTREAVGPDYPVLVKMNSEDFLDSGLTLAESVQVGVMLQERGLDAIELSGGTLVSGELSPSRAGITSSDREAYFKEAAREFKKHVHIPLILVGGNRSHEVAERLIDEGYADYISMSRPFIREPGLINRWAAGDLRPATCLSDNQCFGPALAGEGIQCVVEKKLAEKGEG
ncbi:MAG: NADH:flavin oxidoreductase [Deltaproteobacteria bacterium]|nr:NADH:flavin oxidoreductase [Deltaproteobacteria bacterium]